MPGKPGMPGFCLAVLIMLIAERLLQFIYQGMRFPWGQFIRIDVIQQGVKLVRKEVNRALIKYPELRRAGPIVGVRHWR